MAEAREQRPWRPALRRAGPVLVVTSALCAGGGAWWLLPRIGRWNAERRARTALAALQSCLGDGDGGLADAALRRRTIAADLTGADWPARCAPVAAELHAALALEVRALRRCEDGCCPDDARCQELERVEHLAAEVHAQIGARDFAGGLGAALLDHAARAGLGALAPEREARRGGDGPLRATELAPIAPGPLGKSALSRSVDGRWWLLLHAPGSRAALCEIGLSAATARCAPLPADIAPSADVYLVDGALSPGPHVLAEAAGGDAWAIYGPDGARVLELPRATLGATVVPAGAAALLGEGDGFRVTRPVGPTLELARGSRPLLYAGAAIELDERGALFAHPLALEARAERLASLAGSDAVLRGCMGAELAAVRVRSADGAHDVLVVADPQAPEGRWQALRLPAGYPAAGLSCQGARAHVTTIEAHDQEDGLEAAARYRLRDLRCDRERCAEHEVLLALARAPGSRYFVASLGEELAVLWRSELGDVRARVGRIDALASAPTRSLLEDEEHGGFGWDGRPLALLAAERHALLLAEHGDGIYGFVLDAAGLHPLAAP